MSRAQNRRGYLQSIVITLFIEHQAGNDNIESQNLVETYKNEFAIK